MCVHVCMRVCQWLNITAVIDVHDDEGPCNCAGL